MDVERLLKDFCAAVERRDGAGFARLFAQDGVYHDVFYGAFAGRAKIAELIDVHFYRTARDFRATSRPCRRRTASASASRASRS